nr:hypothetical protein [uncultured Acidocella sp.]
MFTSAAIIGFIFAMLYVMFAQQSFAGAPIVTAMVGYPYDNVG